MPEVSLNPKNQCTFDDPTDGADLPSAAPSTNVQAQAPTAAPVSPCQAQEPGSGGAPSECTDELVRQFGGAQGAGPFAPTPLAKGRECGAEDLSVLGSCGRVAYDAFKDKKVDGFNLASCAGSLASLAKCEFNVD
jgi:hypothetical protein